MTTITTRTVSLSISAPPTLSEVIRTTIGPILGSGSSFTVTIPADVEEGDVMVIIASSRTHQTPEASPFVMGINSYTGWTQYNVAGETTENGFTYAVRRVACESYTRIATGTDAGTNYTFTYAAAPESYYWYFVAFKGTYVDDVWNSEIGFNGLDGYGDETQSNFYVNSTTVVNRHSVLLVSGAIDGNVSTTPPGSYTELADVGNGSVSIFVMAKMANAGASGVIQAYMSDGSAYFASQSLEIQGIT